MGSSKATTVGYWYKVLYHHGLGIGPIDAFLEFRGGDKTAWQGELTQSGTIHVNAPNLWGGEKDQGGIVGDLDVMFGEATQQPNPYLLANLGAQVPAWRGLATVVFKGGKYGAMNPYPHKASYKLRRIKAGWDGGCWYPERAEIPLSFGETTLAISDFTLETGGFETNLASAFTATLSAIGNTTPNVSNGTYWRKSLPVWSQLTGIRFDVRVIDPESGDPLAIAIATETGTILWDFNPRAEGVPAVDPLQRPSFNYDSGNRIYASGSALSAGIVYTVECDLDFASATFSWSLRQGETLISSGSGPMASTGVPRYLYFHRTSNAYQTSVAEFSSVVLTGISGRGSMNPAHVLYYARTNSDIGREPIANINDASFRAAADKLHAEGFGICTSYDPSVESLEDFEERICKLIGGSVSRSVVDGQYYLDLARGDYVLEDLPVLTDDDILEFSEQPSTLDGAINSVSVKYFDPERKEEVTTPPVQALALIDAFGAIHQTYDYPEIPTGTLALRVAERELRATVTPTRAFELVTTRKTYAWRPNQYFRLQAPKRGISDMVCIVGEKQSGTLRSGAIRMTATQDIYSLPGTTFVDIEPGVDTTPPQTPVPITLQRAFEAPYVEVVQALSRADLAVLPADVGFLQTVAADPSVSRDYTVVVSDGGPYSEVATGLWCPTATVVDAAGYLDTMLSLGNGVRLDQVVVGSAALWDDEIVRVDAIDAVAGTVTLGRGCGDTTPRQHTAGSRIWFYDAWAASAPQEYTDGETITVKLLTNTGSQQLPESSASPISLTFDQRQARPYAPGRLRISDSAAADQAYPAVCYAELVVTWAHRDRVLQADQLLDAQAASIGPEAGTTYTLRAYLDDVLAHTQSGISGTTSMSFALPSDGLARIEVEAVRDGLTSWQAASAEFQYRTTPPAARITDAGDTRVTDAGDRRVKES